MIIKDLIRKNERLWFGAIGTVALKRGVVGFLLGKRGAPSHIKSSLSMMVKSPGIMGFPVNITIEPANVCNLKCPVCETGADILRRKKCFMSFDTFKMIIDQIAGHTNTLMFYFMGEPFLNKDAYRMISYAKECGIPFITSCTNGDMVNPELLVKSGIDEINFQIGGTTQETHSLYRIGGNLDKVIYNLKNTIEFKNKFKSNIKIVSGFIVMKHNEHQKDRFIELMMEIGVDEYNIIDPCVRTMEQGLKYLPDDRKHWIYNKEALRRGELIPQVTTPNCPWLYYSVVILANGDIVPCCRDPHGMYVMGNLMTESLKDIWNSEKFKDFRQMVNSSRKKTMGLCKLCTGYGVSEIK